jgi:sugar transferase (PEP-CTERM/EpsH1 system associated)
MKLFVLLSRFPYPLEKGDKLRAYHQIRELSKSNEIYLCALSDVAISEKQRQELEPYCKSIKVIRLSKFTMYWNILVGIFFSKLPFQILYFYSKRAQKEIEKTIISNKIEHIFCQLIRTSEYVKNIKHIPKTLDYMDALSRGMERRVENSPFYLKPFVKIEAFRLKKYEHFIFSYFDRNVIISEQDRDLIVNVNNDTIEIIPNGVEYDFFQAKPMEKKYDLIFTGNMSYEPNVISVEYLANEILPLVQQRIPNIQLVIAGASPSNRVKALANNNVTITGWVEDIRDYYNSAKIFVAPMLIGTGLQNKLLEAMAMKLPCVTSQLANNALGANNGKDILIGENTEDYANHIVSLMQNKTAADELAIGGFKYVSQTFSWENSTRKLEQLFKK